MCLNNPYVIPNRFSPVCSERKKKTTIPFDILNKHKVDFNIIYTNFICNSSTISKAIRIIIEHLHYTLSFYKSTT